MNSRSKGFSVFLIVALAASSLIMAKPAFAQTPAPTSIQIPTPSVPEFSLKYSDTFNIVPPTTTSTTDPYTNKTTTTTIPEHRIENIAINITIENQPFPSSVNGYATNLYYNIRTKPHFGDSSDWETESFTYFPMNFTSGTVQVGYFYLWSQSSSENTTIQYPAGYQAGDEADFQVEAILGYNYTTQVNVGGQSIPLFINTTLFAYKTSGWGPTQTFTMPEVSTSTSPSPYPTVPEFPTLIILPIIILVWVVFFVPLLLYMRKRKPLRSSP